MIAVIIALLAYIAWKEYQQQKQMRTTIAALIARNPAEFVRTAATPKKEKDQAPKGPVPEPIGI